MRSDFVFLEVEGRRIDTWTAAKVDLTSHACGGRVRSRWASAASAPTPLTATRQRAFGELRELASARASASTSATT